jgi:hypothetical protein
MTTRNLSRLDVLEILRRACADAGSLRKWASANDCSAAYVSDVLAGRRDPGPKILKALNLSREVQVRRELLYRKAS